MRPIFAGPLHLYRDGSGVEQSYTKAAELYKMAAAKFPYDEVYFNFNIVHCQTALGALRREDRGDTEGADCASLNQKFSDCESN